MKALRIIAPMYSLKASESLSPADAWDGATALRPESPLGALKTIPADSSCSFAWSNTEEVDITEDLGASGFIELKPIEPCGAEEQRDEFDPYQEIIELFARLKARREARAYLTLGSASDSSSGSASPTQGPEGLTSPIPGKEPMPDSCYDICRTSSQALGTTSSDSSSENASSICGDADEPSSPNEQAS